MSRRLRLTIAAVAAAAILAWAVVPRLLERMKRPPETVEGVSVIVRPPRLGTIERTLSTSGTLVPKNTVTLTSKIAGRIEAILVEEGDQVAAGQLLVQIEREAPSLQVQQAYAAWQAAETQADKARRGVRVEELENTRALLEKAKKDLAGAEENFSRSEKLFQSGAIARAQLEEAESSLRAARTELENSGRTVKMHEQGARPEEQEMARAQAEAARASYELARLQADFTRLRAPEAGVVARVLQDQGNIVGTATPILILVRDDPIQVRIAVPEKYYGEIRDDPAAVDARVYPAAYPGSDAFRGTLKAISPTVDPASRTFAVTVEMANPNGLLRPGMYANVELVLERVDQALLVPFSAVLDRAGESTVFVARAEAAHPRARARKVTLGITNPQEVQVLSGLEPQDRVIVEGNIFLEDGQRITVLRGE